MEIESMYEQLGVSRAVYEYGESVLQDLRQRFEAIDPALVPENSLLREFIGGSSYHYG